MSTVSEILENSNELLFTAEFPEFDSGGMEKIAKHVARIAPWFDAANSTDNTAAHAHASNLSVAIAMKMHGVEPILQIVCRDKNRLAIQADLMGASLHGIENVAMLTGDDVSAGDEPEARRVFDLDGPQAVAVAKVLTTGQYMSGRKINPAPNFYISAVENPAAPPFDYRIQRAIKKHHAGARYIQLQICYHQDRLESFCAGVAAQAPGFHIIPSVVMVKNEKALNFMNEKVPGIDIPSSVIAEVANSEDPSEAAFQLVLEQSKHALSLPGVRGLHIIDFRRDDSLERLMRELGRTPKNNPLTN
jgi:methylenetetrahydrofolate reductase (NADPH)